MYSYYVYIVQDAPTKTKQSYFLCWSKSYAKILEHANFSIKGENFKYQGGVEWFIKLKRSQRTLWRYQNFKQRKPVFSVRVCVLSAWLPYLFPCTKYNLIIFWTLSAIVWTFFYDKLTCKHLYKILKKGQNDLKEITINF